jgi:hypothetical protein
MPGRSFDRAGPGGDRRRPRRGAGKADLPVDEIIAPADTVIVRPDPEPTAV